MKASFLSLGLVCGMLPWTCLQPADAAGLNLQGTVRGSMVRLSDLFTGLEPGQDCEIGPAPDPGRTIIVDSAQLSAIAAQYGVDWTSNGAARATITRLGRRLTNRDVEATIQQALTASGAPADGHLQLAPFDAPMLPVDNFDKGTVEQIDYDDKSGRFAAVVLYGTGQAQPSRLRVVGRLTREIMAVVPLHDVDTSTVLSARDLQVTRVYDTAAAAADQVAITLTSVIGREARRPLMAGQPIHLRDVQPHAVVRRGGIVRVTLNQNGLALSAAFQAMEAGAAGDQIRLVNPSSGAIVVADLQADGSAEIEAGSMPIGTAQPWQIPHTQSDLGRRYDTRVGGGS